LLQIHANTGGVRRKVRRNPHAVVKMSSPRQKFLLGAILLDYVRYRTRMCQ
jgi:hypothetical protein